MQFGLLGEHLPHSFSAAIHSMLASYSYSLCEVPKDKLDSFMSDRAFEGINVTIPYKEAVIPYLDEIDTAAREIGAVNTIVKRGDRLCGYNTDVFGMMDMIRRANISLTGKKVVILGTGGTSKAAMKACEMLGADKIFKVSRRGGDAITYEELYRDHGDTGVLINTTPVGMYPDVLASPVEIDRFRNLSAVIDVIYNPLRTKLIVDARRRGIPTATGLFMLVSQGARASELFTGETISDEKIEAVYNTLKMRKENIVLIGMPSSGKTTVGKLLAERMQRPFVDTDDLIEKEIGMPIRDYFAEKGEDAFRERETACIRSLASKSGIVLATGGGAILRGENVDALQKNGRLYFLDRPLSLLVPTESRPTASTKDAIESRFSERYPIYCETADVRIDGAGDAATAADNIMKEHTK